MLQNWGLKHNHPKPSLGGDAIIFELVMDFNQCGSALTFPSIINATFIDGENLFYAARFNNRTVSSIVILLFLGNVLNIIFV